jgi:hypothetical protein
MSDQFHRHARQFHEQAHQRSVERAREWQQDTFRRQREARAHMPAEARTNQGPRAGGGPIRIVARIITVVVLLAAVAAGVVLLIHSGKLHTWFG